MAAPTIYRGPEDTGISPASGWGMWGPLGEIYAVTVHHSAGPRARTKAQAMALHRAYQKTHVAKGYGDIGYHFSMDDRGRFYVLRDIRFKGSHVLGENTGNVGIMVHGNYEYDRLTRAQRRSLKWLCQGGIFQLTGQHEHEITLLRGHQEWMATACPGKNLMRHLAWRRSRDFR